MNISEYISSGIVESYVLGLASPEERMEFEQLCLKYSELVEARNEFELELEQKAMQSAITPSSEIRSSLLQRINIDITDSGSAIPQAPVVKMNWLRYAAAAAIVVLIGSIIWNINLFSKNQQLQSEIAKLDSNNNSNISRLANLEKDLEMLIQNPNVKMAAMKGMPEMPTAAATVYWDSATKDVYLLVNNLPQPPSDKQYQLWALLNGQPIDVGMIDSEYLIGRKKLLLQMKNVSGAQAFAVTLEAKGGSPTPKGKMYVLGNL